MHSALEAPNRVVHHVLEEASLLILLKMLDAAVAANLLALAQILALFLGSDRRCSESSFCVFGNSFGSHQALFGSPTSGRQNLGSTKCKSMAIP